MVTVRQKLLGILNHPATGWIVIGIGALLRLRRYLQDRGVAHDEAQLSYNILTKSFIQLLHPLDLGEQAAPVGFLFLQKISTLLFGSGELAIRLVPLLAALIALPLSYLVARRVGSAAIAVLAVAFFALDDRLVHYAAEGKQYSTDVLCTVIILWLAIRPAKRNSQHRVIWLAIAGAILIWFSHPALFVLGGLGLALLLERRRFALAACGVWLGSFAVNYVAISRHYAASSYLKWYWTQQHAFAPFPKTAARILWYPKTLAGLFADPLTLAPIDNRKATFILIFAAAAFLVGCFLLLRKNRLSFVIIVGSFFLCCAASALRKYPFADRLLLFAVPLLVLPLGFTLGSDWIAWPPRLALIAILFVYPIYLQAKYAVNPPVLYDVKPAMRYVRSHWQSGDLLYLHWGSDVLGHYYLNTDPRFALTGGTIITGIFEPNADAQYSHYTADLQPLMGHSRVWIVFSMDGAPRDRPIFEKILAAHGRLLDQDNYNGGAAELYDLR